MHEPPVLSIESTGSRAGPGEAVPARKRIHVTLHPSDYRES